MAESPESYNGAWSLVWKGHTFYFLGKIERTKSLTSWPWGKAEYRLPAGPVTSTDNKAVYWSGIATVSWYGSMGPTGQYQGFFHLEWKSGDIQELL
jgi:hypothetical protein